MSAPWYKDGLKFTCKRCSSCCRGESGFVFVSGDEAQEMAAYLSVTVAQFTALYCRVVGGMEGGGANLSLKEKSNGDCIMWSSGGCGVYQVRPLQCRTYPFWQSMLVSREIWEAATADCPGAGSGEMRSAGYINKCRKIMEDKNEA